MYNKQKNLTLTSVVFEFYSNLSNSLNTGYLTLTSVVFEFAKDTQNTKSLNIFNFNKCCIWIKQCSQASNPLRDLTLTSVVFE